MKPLKKNSEIALIAPAGPITEDKLQKAQAKISELGLKSSYTNRILGQHPFLAGSDKDRLQDLHEAFEDTSKDAILCIRGGYGTTRIVDDIDYSLIKRNPKVFIGYSDITALLNSIWQKTGLITFHGVLGSSAFTDYTKQQFTELFFKKLVKNEITTFDKNEISIVKNGKAQGKLVGGNLALVCSLIGTNYEIDFTNKIAFFEDIGEDFYKIDRMLTQLLHTKTFKHAAGIIMGTFNECTHEGDDNSISLNDIFKDRFQNLNIPIINGFSFGHVDNQAIFPVGINAELDTENCEKITIKEQIFD